MLLLILLMTWVLPAQAEDPVAAAARTEQEVLPAWEARQTAALRRVQARRAWFQGTGPFAAAFPDLAGDPLNARALLQGRLALLDARGVQRARERAAPLPPGPRQVADTRAALLAAEEEADELERKLLLGLLAGLEMHPEREAGQLAVVLEPWSQVVEAGEAPEGTPEEETRARAMEAARAQREVRATEQLVRALQLYTVTGRDRPDPADDLAALAGQGDPPEIDPAAAIARLRLLLPALDEPQQAEIEETLTRWWTEDGLVQAREALQAAQEAAKRPVPDGTTIEELQAAFARAEQAHAIAVAEQGAAQTVPEGPVRDTRQQVAALRVAAAQITLDAARRHLMEANAASGDLDAAEALRFRQEEAQRAADEAEANAEDVRARRRADVLSAVARATERAAALREQLAEATARAREGHERNIQRVAGVEARIERLRVLSAFDKDRPVPDEVNRELRELTTELRRHPVARGRVLGEAQGLQDRVRQRVVADTLALDEARELALELEADERAALERAIRDWEQVLADETATARRMVELATQERDDTLRALHRARELRRSLVTWISAQERVRDRSHLLEDVGQELALLGPSVVTMVRGRIQALVQAPGKLLDFNVIRGIIVESFWTFVLVGAWLWARQQVPEAARRITDRIHQLRPEMRVSDVMALRDPVARFLFAFIGLLLGWLLVGRLGELLPELGFVLLIYLQVALYRVLLAFFDLVVVKSTDVRPAVMVLRAAEYDLARNTVRVFLGYVIARRFAQFLLWDLLGLDVITNLVATAFTLAGLGLLGWALYVWEPALRARIARRKEAHRAVVWLARTDDSAALRVARSVGIIGFYSVALFVELFYLVARERSSVGRLLNVVTRYRLKDHVSTAERLDDAVVEQITGPPTPADRCVERPEVGPAVDEALTYWLEHRRQGMVAIVGDRGAGKRTTCDAVAKQLSASGMEVTRAYLQERLLTEADMLRWLAHVAGVPEAPNADALIEAIEALPARVFLLEGMHRAFSRQVGGFEAMAALIYVQNATCDNHFFVASFHRPAWDFLASIPTLVDVGVYRTVVRLAPLTAAQLRELTVTRAELADRQVDFSSLVRPNPLGGDPTVDQERAVDLFYRLLSEASEGNPTVALHLFSQCLEPIDEATVRVHMSAALNTPLLEGLSDAALFVLVALRIQDDLDEQEIVSVTNLPHSTVRATVRDLLGRGLLVRAGERVRVPIPHFPAVNRTLRRRHLLHFEG